MGSVARAWRRRPQAAAAAAGQLTGALSPPPSHAAAARLTHKGVRAALAHHRALWQAQVRGRRRCEPPHRRPQGQDIGGPLGKELLKACGEFGRGRGGRGGGRGARG